MDYAQRQKFTLQIAAAAGAAAAATALICAQAPEGDEDWEIDSATAETVENVVNLLNSLTSSMRATQSGRESNSLSECGLQAIERLHKCETDLDDARMTALRDLFTLDEGAANVYVVLKKESLRKCWIQRDCGRWVSQISRLIRPNDSK